MQRNSYSGPPCPCGVDEEIANENKLIPADKTVSSRGCNRLFIVSVLLSALEHLKSATHGRVFPAPPEIVSAWLETAKTYCSAANDTTVYGGPAFNINDPSTHWSEPQQFLTWWKNFVERRRKQESLLRDASYNGDDERRQQRARFCRHILHLCSLIRRRHQELQQMPEEGIQQHPQQMLSSDPMMLGQNGMARATQPTANMNLHPRALLHPSSMGSSSSGAKMMPLHGQSQPASNALRYSHIPPSPVYSAGVGGPQTKQSVPVHVTTMAHMLPQQPLPQVVRMPAQHQQQQQQQQQQSLADSRVAISTAMASSSQPQASTTTTTVVSATTDVRASQQQSPARPLSPPPPTCCGGCKAPSSPMTTLFDSITSAYDAPDAPPDDDAPHTGQCSHAAASLNRSRSADFAQHLAVGTKPSYDFPVRKRRRHRSGSSAASSGNLSESANESGQAAPTSQMLSRKDVTSLPPATVKAAITRICNSKDDIMDRFDILLQEFQKAVQVKQAQTDLLKRYLQCTGAETQAAKRPRFPALGTYDIGSRYANVQEMLDVALADTHTPPSGHCRKACSEALCILCGNSVQAIWTFFCSQGPETLERALVLRAGYTIPEAQAVVRHFESLAATHQAETMASVTPPQDDEPPEEQNSEAQAEVTPS